jgi:uncharacterized protein YjiS (DUF1127 family)
MQSINLSTPLARSGGGFSGTARSAVASVWNTLREWGRILSTRNELGLMDDRMLADLGISCAQADFQLSKRPWRLADKPFHR